LRYSASPGHSACRPILTCYQAPWSKKVAPASNHVPTLVYTTTPLLFAIYPLPLGPFGDQHLASRPSPGHRHSHRAAHQLSASINICSCHSTGCHCTLRHSALAGNPSSPNKLFQCLLSHPSSIILYPPPHHHILLPPRIAVVAARRRLVPESFI
jgi:hypothetical protein